MSPQRAGAGAVGAPVPVNSAAPRGRRGWSLLAVVAGSTFPVLAACGGTPAAAPPPTSTPATTRVAPPATTAAPATTATTAPVPVPVDDETQVRAVIDTYWQEWTIAMAEADPARPALLATLDGDARDRVTDDIKKKNALNEISIRRDSGVTPHETESVALGPQGATVVECVTDDGVLIERTTRSTLNDRIETLVLRKSLSRDASGVWRITESTAVRTLSPGEPCTAG